MLRDYWLKICPHKRNCFRYCKRTLSYMAFWRPKNEGLAVSRILFSKLWVEDFAVYCCIFMAAGFSHHWNKQICHTYDILPLIICYTKSDLESLSLQISNQTSGQLWKRGTTGMMLKCAITVTIRYAKPQYCGSSTICTLSGPPGVWLQSLTLVSGIRRLIAGKGVKCHIDKCIDIGHLVIFSK